MSELNGVLLVNKPSGMTSHDVVARLRRISGQRRIGHIGTLDPMADGLLVMCLGRATRIVQFLMGLDKVYLGSIELGGMSSTYDAEGDITRIDRPIPKDEATIAQAMATQLGPQIQLPPPFSAVKVRGKKLYEYARAGEVVPEKPRTVFIHRFELLHYEPPQVHFEAKVGSGTYIRSMAHNMGLALGCGAFLSRLRRVRIGAFALEDAWDLESLAMEPDMLPLRLLGIGEALGHLPKVTVQPSAAAGLMNGCAFTSSDIVDFDGILDPGRPVLVLDEDGRVLSIAQPVARPAGAPDEEGAVGDNDVELVMGASRMVFKPMKVLATR